MLQFFTTQDDKPQDATVVTNGVILFPSIIPLQQQSTSNVTSFKFDLYSELVAGIDSPFILIFLGVLLFAVISYTVQYKQLKRNQHALFWMLFALSLFASFQNMTRLASELSFLHPDYWTAFQLNNWIKMVDRSMAAVLLYTQILIMGLISFAFMTTSRATGDISQKTYKICVAVLIVILVVLFVLFLLGHVMVILILHILRTIPNALSPKTSLDYSIVIFTSPMIILLMGLVATSVLLNTFGFRLLATLRRSKQKVKQMIITKTATTMALATTDADSVSGSDSTPRAISNNNNLSNLSDCDNTSISSELQTKECTVDSNVNLKSLQKATLEQDRTYQMKKQALRRVLSLQLGLSIFFFVQFIGLCFIPGAISWQFSLLCYHAFSNVGVLGFMIILLCIYHPLKEVQRLFHKDKHELQHEMNDMSLKTNSMSNLKDIQKV
ncbi:hypothetical protein C9374_011542 [Naegleria lovaniensis]|uniref:Uncharacterized protein n=1 Tax=Naegleria lovaniensis TaxID=51637 RepID=A0AA88H4M0_NAELO|nr:uncharacterized protein C9374_011542 [Naegleria lovaniensis]KAG2392817.1 hypothetical protein C9374_011542 [Naegleria lovaniensis]